VGRQFVYAGYIYRRDVTLTRSTPATARSLKCPKSCWCYNAGQLGLAQLVLNSSPRQVISSSFIDSDDRRADRLHYSGFRGP